MPFFEIIRDFELERDEEIALLHGKGRSIEKLATDLLYDREWCGSQGIRYYDLKTPDEASAWDMAEKFVIDSIIKYWYLQNDQEQAGLIN